MTSTYKGALHCSVGQVPADSWIAFRPGYIKVIGMVNVLLPVITPPSSNCDPSGRRTQAFTQLPGEKPVVWPVMVKGWPGLAVVGADSTVTESASALARNSGRESENRGMMLPTGGFTELGTTGGGETVAAAAVEAPVMARPAISANAATKVAIVVEAFV